ncbi:hypothetical protein Tco_0086924 [Tanacetum coccineum]
MMCILYVDPESSTQADEAQSSRVLVPLLKDQYEAIRQAYLVRTDTKSEPFEGEAEASESPHTVASPTSLPDSTPPAYYAEESEGSDTSSVRSTSSDSTAPLSPDHSLTHTTSTLVPILHRTTRMAVHVPPAMSSGLSANLPLRKRYRGMFELVEDSEEDKEIEESMDSNSVSEDAEDEGPTVEDEDPTAGDEGLAVGVEGPGMDDESHGSDDGSHRLHDEGHSIESDGLGLEEEEEDVPGDLEDGMVYIDVPAYTAPAPPVQTPPSPEWSSGSLPISLSPFVVPSPISSPMILLTVPSPVAMPATAETEGFLTELGAQVEMHGGLIHDHVVQLEDLSPALFERSLEYEQERVIVTFGAIWRPMLAIESWAGQTDAQRAAL